MLSRFSFILPLLSGARLVSATLRLTNLDVTPAPLTALTLTPQEPDFAFDLYSALPPASVLQTQDIELPGECGPYVGPGQECTTNMTATSVFYEDCGDPFTVCRCADAAMSIETVLDRFGRVPIGLRRYVGTIVVLNDTEPHAYTLTSGDIHFFADCAMDTWVHESTHSFDFATPDAPHSSVPGWSQAIANDSCVPDNYSDTNRVEDFAQMSVIKTYMLLYDGHLPPGFRADCMSHQLDFLGALPVYNASALFGNTCIINDGLPGPRTVSTNFAAPAAAFRTGLSTLPSPTPTTMVIGMRLGCRLILSLAVLPFSLGSPTIAVMSELATRDSDGVMELPLPALNLTPQQPDFSSFDLTSALPPAYTTGLLDIDLPEYCAGFVGDGQECATSMTAQAVVFEDCGSPFVICRCTDAQMSLDTVLDRFGRVPVGLRRYAGTVVILNDTSPHAYTVTTGQTHYFGDVQMNSWMTHTFDFALATPQSSAAGWANALMADTCVPDNYSLTNEVEDFAQVSVIKVYSLLYGNLPPGFSADCMSNQLAFISSFELYDPGTLFGNNCDIVDNGPPARETSAPAVLDPSRTFQTVSPDDDASPTVTGADVQGPSGAASTQRASNAQSSRSPTSFLLYWTIAFAAGAYAAVV
ncbi:hypothetical protein B0H11DRAFT_1797858 [Mycena galericulata]|nr:hypothetical protein B0H11DRAFT_1797858 [Mycena galericulata]